jgi:hypothetical protein
MTGKILTLKDILDLQEGEVVKYETHRKTNRDNTITRYSGLIIVDKVESERGRVSGALMGKVYGVNSIEIQVLLDNGINLTKWRFQQ